MNVCSRCHEVKEKGRYDGINFTCSECIGKEAAVRAQTDRRQVQPDGTVRYHCGNIAVIPELIPGVTIE